MNISLINPVPGSWLSDGFGWRDAISGVVDAMLHDGQDFAANAGTPIVAAHDGTIGRSWWDVWASNGAPAGGNAVSVVGNGFETRSYHMQHPTHLAVGTKVRAGDIIGYVGATGAVTGAHLHFTLFIYGTGAVDPVPYLNAATPTNLLQGEDMPWILILMQKHHYLVISQGSAKPRAILLGSESLNDPSTKNLPKIQAYTADFTQDDLFTGITGIRKSHLPRSKKAQGK